MAPHPVRKKGSPTKKCRVEAGMDYDLRKWDKVCHLQHTWVGFHPGTRFYCHACYNHVNDPVQHVNRNHGCGKYLAVQYIQWLYEENYSTDTGGQWAPDANIVAAMLNDPNCVLSEMDIIAQEMEWDPSTNFVATPKQPNIDTPHTCCAAVVATSFHQLYETYAQQSRWGPSYIHVPEHLHQAARRATNPVNFLRWASTTWNSLIEREIDRRVENGTLQRVNPANGQNN